MRINLSLLFSLISVSSLTASPLDSISVYRKTITFIEDERLPRYAVIDIDITNESKQDLSGEWSTSLETGWLELRRNGLGNVKAHVWGDELADIKRGKFTFNWKSADEEQSQSLTIPLDTTEFTYRSAPLPGEWTCREMRWGVGERPPFTTIFIPIPVRLDVIAVDAHDNPTDTLFTQTNFSGEAVVEWNSEAPSGRSYTFLVLVNGKFIEEKRLILTSANRR